MKLAAILPKNLFHLKKSRSVSRSPVDPLSFNSQTTSYSSASSEDGYKAGNCSSTPKTVLPTSASFDLKQAFEMIDSDGDGKIRKEDLEALICRLTVDPPSKEDLESMLEEVDRDGDGCITLEEFYAIGAAFAPPTCDMEVRNTFDFFDADGNGKITAEELYSAFRTIGDRRCTLEDCRRMIRGVDRNGDGFVCFEDFSRMMDRI